MDASSTSTRSQSLSRPRASAVMRILWSAVGFLATLHVALWQWTPGQPHRALSVRSHSNDDESNTIEQQEGAAFTEAYKLPEPSHISSFDAREVSKSQPQKPRVRGVSKRASSSDSQYDVSLPLSHVDSKQDLKTKTPKKKLTLEPDPTGIFPLPEPKAPSNITLSQLEHLIINQHQQRHSATINRQQPAVPVVLWPHVYLPLSSSAEYIHLFDNALQESKYFTSLSNLTNDSVSDPRMVWWVDLHMAESEFCDAINEEDGEESGDEEVDDDSISDDDETMVSQEEELVVEDDQCWCRELTKDVLRVLSIRYDKGLPTIPWPIHIIDLHDGDSASRCSRLDGILGLDWVHYVKRSQVIGREWNDDKTWVDTGRSLAAVNRTWSEYFRPISLPVRTDIVAATATYLQTLTQPKSLWDPIEKMNRPYDVTHFWPLDEKGVGSTHVAKLRLYVSIIIDSMGKREGFKTFTGTKGKPLKEGRRGVDMDYIRGMMETKILVVTQRDAWEGHYRLFEAMVSGACVFSDTMIGLPNELKNGTSIVLFDGSESLRSLLAYYLEHESERLDIAKRGRLTAMSMYRSWHIMERITFGEPLSKCSDAHENSRCPFIVHANESQE